MFAKTVHHDKPAPRHRQSRTAPVSDRWAIRRGSDDAVTPILEDGLAAQLQTLADRLSLSALLLVSRSATKTDCLFSYSAAGQRLPVALLEVVQSGQWTVPAVPALTVCEVSLPDAQVWGQAYLCRFGWPQKPSQDLLVWSQTPLSDVQKCCIEQQAQLLQLQQQQSQPPMSDRRVLLLEQIIQRIEHQLRNPLALIELYADVLLQTLPTHSAQIEQAQSIRQVAQGMGGSLKHLTRCGLLAQLEVGSHSLPDLMAECLQECQPQLQAKQLMLGCDTRPLQLDVDRWQMKQVLLNVLHNAIAFSPSQGTLTCRWQQFQREVLIEICDQGPGFSPADLKQLFKPFYSRREGGTGLGLTIAQKMVLDHQGAIWADNLPEGGAQISISLPCSCR